MKQEFIEKERKPIPIINLKVFASELKKQMSAKELAEKMGFSVEERIKAWARLANECYEMEGPTPFAVRAIGYCLESIDKMCQANNIAPQQFLDKDNQSLAKLGYSEQ